jgi:hypothetical protein
MSRSLKRPKETANAPRRANGNASSDYQPRTAHGKLLVELRRKIIAEGTPLLTLEQVRREVQNRRGGGNE